MARQKSCRAAPTAAGERSAGHERQGESAARPANLGKASSAGLGEKAMPNERRERNVRGEEETKCSRSRCSEGKRAAGSEGAEPNRPLLPRQSELHEQPSNTTRVTVT